MAQDENVVTDSYDPTRPWQNIAPFLNILVPNILGAAAGEAASAEGAVTGEAASMEATATSSEVVAQENAISKVTEAQLENLKRFESKLPVDAKETQIVKLPNGNAALRADVPARNVPNSYARYEKIIDSNGKTIEYIKTTYAPDGSIVHVKVK